jgi:hypothetical protein
MAMETRLSNAALGVEPHAHHYAQIVSLPTAGILAGMVLTVGLLVLALPFSDQIAISLSLLS